VTASLETVRIALADHYAIDREVGRGGMATVYVARDLKHNRPVAIKVLHPELAEVIGGTRFLREIEIAAHLQHPHVLTLIDSGEAGGFLYYVMPFVDGESLRTKLAREHELPLTDAVRILRDVADALAEAHARGVVHRDVKPDNVLLRGHHAVVTDFGVAKALSEATGAGPLTTAGAVNGTPAYMAPEQAAGDSTTDHRADIYSFGVMAYEMLAGRPPFVGSTAQMVVAAHMTETPEPITRHRSTTPAPLAALVMRCLEKRPADRWQHADEILHQLEALATPVTVAVTRSSIGATLGTRRRKILIAGAVAAVIVLAFAGYAVVSARRGEKPASGVPMLAVLPLENIGAVDDEYFADGMTEELNSRLSRLSGLGVIARTSSRQYKGTTKSIAQIGKELGADYLLRGTIRRERSPNADRVRITPQLVRASDGRSMWAEPYDKPYRSGIFEIQSDVAERVADALSVALLATERRAVNAKPTDNLKAYDRFLQAQALGARVESDWDAQRAALELYQEATRLDPTFASAYAGMAVMHRAMSTSFDVSLPAGITFTQRAELAKQAAQHALALDSSLASPHIVLGWYYTAVAHDTVRSRKELEILLRVEPSDPEGFWSRGYALLNSGSREAGIRDLERAVSLDPRNPTRLRELGDLYLTERTYQTAEAYFDRAIAVDPSLPISHTVKVWVNLVQGRVDQARVAMREGVRQVGVDRMLFDASTSSTYIRALRVLAEDYDVALKAISWDAYRTDSVDYFLTKTIAFRKDAPRVRAYYDSLAMWAAPRAQREDSRSWQVYHIVWAMGLAGSGRRDEAIREIERLRSDEQRLKLLDKEMMAEVCVLAADYTCAVTYIGLAMADPYELTPQLLRIDPFWNPLRQRADFQKLATP